MYIKGVSQLLEMELCQGNDMWLLTADLTSGRYAKNPTSDEGIVGR